MDVSQIVSTWTPPTTSGSAGTHLKSEELKDAAQKFEALLLNQFLGQALKPLLHDSLGSNAPGSHLYQHMLTDTISSQLSNQESFGMSNLLHMQLMGQFELTEPQPPITEK